MKFLQKKNLKKAVVTPLVGLAILNQPTVAIALDNNNDSKHSAIERTKEKLMAKQSQAEYVFNELDRMDSVGIDVDNLLTPSHISLEEVQYLLKDTGLYECSQYYIDAEKEYGVNALALMSITALESAWGKSKLARLKNNLSGFMAYNVETFDSAYTFGSKRDSIMGTAKHLKEKYLVPSGKYYTGTGFENVNYYYCTLDDGKSPDYGWSSKLINLANEFEKKLDKYHEQVKSELIMTL